MTPDQIGTIKMIVEVLLILGGICIAVARMESRSDLLSQSIDHLAKSVDGLHSTIRRIEHKQTDHESRIRVLESHQRSHPVL